MKWRINGTGRVYDCNEPQVIYFNLLTGDTHLITQYAAAVIELLDDQGVDLTTLGEKLSPSVDPGEITTLTATLPQVLEELAALDIVQPVT